MTGDDRAHRARFQRRLPDKLHFGVRVICERIHRNHHIHPELQRVLDVLDHICRPLCSRSRFSSVYSAARFAGDHFRSAAVHLESADGGNQHHHLRGQPE